MRPIGPFTRAFIWLSGASDENLEDCPPWERRKYVAFGATVLVPCLFAMMASAYAVSTLTDNWYVIIAVATVWSFIILTVDRALLATYRAYQGFFRKLSQFSLRVVVAALMGITISHPLTLLLFKDTISSVIEKERDVELAAVRAKSGEEKKVVEAKITALDADIAKARLKWDETFTAKFLGGEEDTGKKPLTDDEKKAKAEFDKKVAEANAPTMEKLEATKKEIAALGTQATKIQGELDFWQKEFENELNGQRSGIIGLGPRAKSIQSDQLAWRRDESKRLSTVLEAKTVEKTSLEEEATRIEAAMIAEAETKAADLAMKKKQEVARIDALKQQVQQQQADQFVGQQNQIRETLKAQIDARLEQAKQFQNELQKLSDDEQSRVAIIRAEPRRDILKQTLALHHLFAEGAEGGVFALTAYAVLSALFMLVDTIPLMVKFFSKPGPYDTLVDQDEVRFDSERSSFLKSYKRYMEDLSSGRLLHLTKNRPLEQTLIEGVDRSRAAKEFLESLLDLEKTFQARVSLEREAMAAGPDQGGKRVALLQDFADSFYKDLRGRMEQFFQDASPSRATTL